MITSLLEKNRKKSERIINILAIVVPIAVAGILGIREKVELGLWTKVLPHVIGVINTLTALCLILGYYFIKKNNRNSHRQMMTLAFALGAVFLVCYILYHISNESTSFGGTGTALRFTYYFLLISHILLSIVVVWFVLRAVYFGITNQLPQHRKAVRFAFPIWLYVSVSGVVVYLMISPYYV
jgi:putative membrane protein